MIRQFRQPFYRIPVAGLLLTALLLAVLSLWGAPVLSAAPAVLKVGYSSSGSIYQDGQGNYCGYAVDYLEEIAKHTGWTYEYVYDSWADNQQKLIRGELDLLVMVRYTLEREESLLFSDLPMGQDSTVLYAQAGSDVYYQDYGAFDGCRVAVTEGTIFAESFTDYAREQGLRCTVMPYATEDAAREALLRGEVKLMAASGFSDRAEIKPVDRFRLEGVYVATGKGNTALMAQVNRAMQQARLENTHLEEELQKKHFALVGTDLELYLTREEAAYLASAGPVLVKSFDERHPLSYRNEDGQMVGLLADYMDMLGHTVGLEFVYRTTGHMSLEDNAAAMVTEGSALLFVDRPLAEAGLDKLLYKTEPLFHSSLAYIKRQEDVVSKYGAHTFAINREMAYLEALLLETNSDSLVRFYDTSQQCMEAVADGQADMAILDEHVAAYLLQKPRFVHELIQVPGSGAYGDSICLYVPEAHRPLVSILNKAIKALPEEAQTYLIANSMLNHAYYYGLDDFFYEHGNAIWLGVVALVVITALVVVLYVRIGHLRKQRKENQALQERIQTDELTGVLSRAGFFDKAGEMIRQQAGEGLCIVRINIRHFKVVNDLYGTEKGDRLLREMGRDLKEMGAQRGFLVGRFTADHFYLCIRQTDFESIGFAGRSGAPWLGMDVNTVYGIYPIEPGTSLPVSAMCDRADMAMGEVSRSASEYIRYYSDETRQKLLREQEIENEMEQALAQRQFCIYIQPKYDVETETIVGGEALVRWMHPQKGMIPPGVFIGLFERNGFILKLDYYIWEECCRFLAAAREKGLPLLPLSTNVSRIHFYGTDLEEKLTGLIRKYGLEPGLLELEVTEGLCAEEPDLIFRTCARLREAGFPIAMDDFGSGYSSLNMLKEMPLDIIKMDLGFLSAEAGSQQDEKGQSILQTLIQLAHTLELRVVVEGLETAQQRDFIHSIGGCSAQGYYYSKPVECRRYEEMIG